jgi:hypothetical protein
MATRVELKWRHSSHELASPQHEQRRAESTMAQSAEGRKLRKESRQRRRRNRGRKLKRKKIEKEDGMEQRKPGRQMEQSTSEAEEARTRRHLQKGSTRKMNRWRRGAASSCTEVAESERWKPVGEINTTTEGGIVKEGVKGAGRQRWMWMGRGRERRDRTRRCCRIRRGR